MPSTKQKTGPTGRSINPAEVARALETSITNDFETHAFLPDDPLDVAALARWGNLLGLERRARRSWAAASLLHTRRGNLTEAAEARAKATRPGPYREKDLAEWIRDRVSPWPERFKHLAEELRRVEAKVLTREVARLDECGHPWGRVVRLFWRGAGGEFSRTYGQHRCKSRHCPVCGKLKQNELTEDIERVLEIAREWGLGPENVRFLTLTVRNGQDIPTLREKAHKAWAKLQRRRWWPRWVAMWFRGTECVTGEDGNWNFHLHVVLVLWGHRMSYQRLWSEWESAVGERSQLDVDRLHTQKMREARHRGGIAAAARYVVKYIGKAEAVKDLTRGPGGFAHYAGSMIRVRAFAMGGAASVLRKLAGVLLPSWARRLEGILEDAYLWNGMPPVRAEDVDTETGEVTPCEPMSPALDAQARAQAVALATPLLQMGGSVGQPCGPNERWRRIGWNPVRGQLRTVKDHLEHKPLSPLHRLVNGGNWKIEHVKDVTKAGKVLRYRVVLPAARFAWREVARMVWRKLGEDVSAWAQRRREAFRAWAEAKVGPLDRRDAKVQLLEGLRQAQTGARVEAYRLNQELDQERRKEVADPELVAWLVEMRDFLRQSPFRRRVTRAWADFDFAVLGI